MKFHTSRDKALESLDTFINNDIVNYSSKRNYDFGSNERDNVSCLSPYISHRLLDAVSYTHLTLPTNLRV